MFRPVRVHLVVGKPLVPAWDPAEGRPPRRVVHALSEEVQSEMQRTLGREWPLVRMLEYPTIAAFAQYLEQGTDEHVTAAATRRSQGRRAALLKRRSAASVARV